MANSIRKQHWTLFRDPKSSDIWQMRTFIKGADGRTRKVRKSTRTADPEEAARVAGEIWVRESRLGGGTLPPEAEPRARVTVVVAGANWIAALEEQEKEGKFRAKYASRFESDLNTHLIHMWAYVDEIPLHDPEAMLAALEKRHKSKKDGSLGWNSIVRLACSVRLFAEHCMKVGFLDKKPMPRLESYLPEDINKHIAREKRKTDSLTREERKAFLDALKTWDPHDGETLPKGTAYRFYTVMHYSLLRRGEAWAITPAWIDSKAKLIRIPASDSKSGKEEEIPLHKNVEKALKEQIAVRGTLEKNVPIFGVINVKRAFTYAMAKAGITKEGITPHHHARHSGATIAAGETTDMLAIQSLGFANAK